MKKIVIIAALVAWMSVPFICKSGFQDLFAELRDSSLLIHRTCKTAGVDMDNDPWRSCLKRADVRLAFRMRDKYIIPVGIVWVAIGAGLFTGLRETWGRSQGRRSS